MVAPPATAPILAPNPKPSMVASESAFTYSVPALTTFTLPLASIPTIDASESLLILLFDTAPPSAASPAPARLKEIEFISAASAVST